MYYDRLDSVPASKGNDPVKRATPDHDLEAAAAVELPRIDPPRNMRRFCRLVIARDMFGGFLLAKQ